MRITVYSLEVKPPEIKAQLTGRKQTIDTNEVNIQHNGEPHHQWIAIDYTNV